MRLIEPYTFSYQTGFETYTFIITYTIMYVLIFCDDSLINNLDKCFFEGCEITLDYLAS